MAEGKEAGSVGFASTFKNYKTGDVVELGEGVSLGTSDFTFACVAVPDKLQYGMLFSQDRSGDPTLQCRLEMHADGCVVMAGLGVEMSNDPAFTKGKSVDGNGWASALGTTKPLKLNTANWIRLQRSGKTLALTVNAEVLTVETEVVNQTKPSLRLRMGSRYPPSSGSEAHDAFQGRIMNGYLNIGGTFWIQSANCPKVIDVQGGVDEDGTSIIQYTPHEGWNQQFSLIPVAGLSLEQAYFIQNEKGKVLDVRGGSEEPGADVILYHLHGGTNQQWSLKNVGLSTFQIQSVKSGLVMDVAGGSKENSAKIIQYGNHGGPNQQWMFLRNNGMFP